jgi:hypothetical protein
MYISKGKIKANPLQTRTGCKPATGGGGYISKLATLIKEAYGFCR